MAIPRQVSLTVDYDGTIKRQLGGGASSGSGSSSSGADSYTVRSGDTLWALAKKYYGSGAKYTIIYDANKEIIESTAKSHGKSSSDHGHWIWPGEQLVIPAAGSGGNQSGVQIIGTPNPKLGTIIANTAESLSYTDVSNGESDSVSVSMHDIDKHWIGKYKPQRGAAFGIKINLKNWNRKSSEEVFNCGNFIMDDISFSGRPLSCVLSAVSVPAVDDFKSLPRTNTWEKTTVRDIAARIADAACVALVYEADDIQVEELEQSKQTDSAFLYGLAAKYGLGMKVYNHKIVIYDFTRYEEKGSTLTIDETDMLKWEYNQTIEGTYTGVDLNYTNPDIEDSINVSMGEEGRMYSINVQANSQYDAELQAAAKANEANRKIETLSLTIRANPRIIATSCVTITGLQGINGKYFIDKVKHSVGSSGYTMQLTLHKVQKPIRVTAPVAASCGDGQWYIVVSGDTLWALAKKYYGSGSKYSVIYNANTDTIENTAKEHGKSSSSNGHWIWPGEKLWIPAGG